MGAIPTKHSGHTASTLSNAELGIGSPEDLGRLSTLAMEAALATQATLDSHGQTQAHQRFAPMRMGRYVVLERLGVGGMGVVFAAYDERLERKVALKVLAPHRAGSAASLRLLREAQSLAKLSHPNVITIYEVDSLPDGSIFLAMELVKGSTLRDWQYPTRPWREIVAMYSQAAAGLAAAHRAGIVHRDFKPDNVLVGEDGRARVLDFGLALLGDSDTDTASGARAPVSSTGAASLHGHSGSTHPGRPALTVPGTIMGTPGYMSPEQLAGTDSDARSDQFSFCVALYEAVYGERPFVELSVSERATKAERRPRLTQPHAAWLWAVLDRGLALAPAERFASMDALIAELTRDHGRRRRYALVTAAVLASAGVALGAGVLWQQRAQTPLCEPPRQALAGIWDEARKQSVESALLGTKLPFAAAAWRVAERSLDSFAQDWLAAHQDACKATHEQRVQSHELLDLRVECLAERKRSLAAVADALASQPARAAERTAELLAGLGDLEVCADTRALRLGPALPQDADTLGLLDRVRTPLVTGHALLAAGDLAGADAALASARQAAAMLDYAPVQAEILHLDGRLAEERGDIARAVELLRQAVDTAVAARHDELVADAWLSLAMEAGPRHDQPRDAHEWLRHAGAALRRLDHPGDPRRIHLEHARGRIEIIAGNYRTAAEILARALEDARARWGSEDARVAELLNERAHALAMSGAAAEARSAYEAALEIGLRTLGPEHPKVAGMRLAMGLLAAQQLGRLDQAETELAEALRVYRAVYGDDALEVGRVYQGMSQVRMFRGQYGDALADAERAAAVFEQRLGTRHPRYGEALMGVGVLQFMVGDIAGSLRAYRGALAVLEPALGAQHGDVGLLRSNIGEALLAQGEVAEAVAELGRALAIMAPPGAPDADQHPELAFPLKGLGLAYLAQKRPAAAIEPLERALALRSNGAGDPQERAEIQWALARALGAVGRDAARRRALATEALATYRALGPTWHQRARDITGWLKASHQEK